MSLFFMLSGFVLAMRYTDSGIPFKKYFLNRFARIYPVYIAAAIFTLPWIGISLEGGSTLATIKNVGQIIFLVTMDIFLIQAWFPPLFSLWNNGGSWSISVEAFCYLLLPVVLPTLARFTQRQLLQSMAVCYILAILPGFCVVLFDFTVRGTFYSMPLFRLPEFLIGAQTFLLWRSGLRLRASACHELVIAGLLTFYLAFMGAMLPESLGQNRYIIHDWIVLPVISLLILSLIHGQGVFSKLLSTAPMVWLGKISYCFYAFQAIIILGLISDHDRIVEAFPALSDNHLLLAVAFVLLLAMSAAGYYLIEEPARKRLRKIS